MHIIIDDNIKKEFWENINYPKDWKEHPEKLNYCWTYKKEFINIVSKFISMRDLSYIIHHKQLPDNTEVKNICTNPTCVNPNHLFLDNHYYREKIKLKGLKHQLKLKKKLKLKNLKEKLELQQLNEQLKEQLKEQQLKEQQLKEKQLKEKFKDQQLKEQQLELQLKEQQLKKQFIKELNKQRLKLKELDKQRLKLKELNEQRLKLKELNEQRLLKLNELKELNEQLKEQQIKEEVREQRLKLKELNEEKKRQEKENFDNRNMTLQHYFKNRKKLLEKDLDWNIDEKLVYPGLIEILNTEWKEDLNKPIIKGENKTLTIFDILDKRIIKKFLDNVEYTKDFLPGEESNWMYENDLDWEFENELDYTYKNPYKKRFKNKRLSIYESIDKNVIEEFLKNTDYPKDWETHPEKLNDCWEYKVKHFGQYKMTFKGRIVRANRLSYMIYHEPISSNRIKVISICNNPACVNPNHIVINNKSVSSITKKRLFKRELNIPPNIPIKWKNIIDKSVTLPFKVKLNYQPIWGNKSLIHSNLIGKKELDILDRKSIWEDIIRKGKRKLPNALSLSTDDDIIQLISDILNYEYEEYSEIQEAYKCDYLTIRRILDRIDWTHVTDNYSDEELNDCKSILRKRLTRYTIDYIKNELEKGIKPAQISKELGVTEQTISQIKTGRSYKLRH